MKVSRLTGMAATLALAAVLPAATITLDSPLTPTGAPGETVGWGYSIDNDTNSYLVLTSVTPSGFGGVPGIFIDYLASINGIIVAPNTLFSEGFSALNETGFGEFAIDAGATPGSSTAGTFAVTYDLLVNDPLAGGLPDLDDAYGLTFSTLEAGVEVTAISDVPEPTTVALTGAALLALAGIRRRALRR